MTQTSNLSEPVMMTIAGFDPTGGAGVAADLKTFAAHGCYGVAAITAVTVPSPNGLDDVHPMESDLCEACIRSLLRNISIRAVKIGMLATRANAQIVLEVLEANPSLPAVLDPIVRSPGGQNLIDPPGLELVRDRLLRQVAVITPNLPDASALTGLKVENLESMKDAAHKLVEMGARAVVVTGGHLERPIDVFIDGSHQQTFAGDRVKPENIYGAGCTFSSALAADLGQGRQLAEAVVLAKAYVTGAIKKAYAVGTGRTPLNHFYRVREGHRPADHSALEPVH